MGLRLVRLTQGILRESKKEKKNGDARCSLNPSPLDSRSTIVKIEFEIGEEDTLS